MRMKVMAAAVGAAFAAMSLPLPAGDVPRIVPLGDAAVSTVQSVPFYNSWPMVQTVGDRVVCAYSRGSGHSIGEGRRGVYARVSLDGGKTWGDETPVVNDPSVGEVTIGKGLDENGRMLLWVRRWGRRTGHDLYRTTDGVSFEKISSPAFSPMPVQVTDVFHVPGKGMVSLWFSGTYPGDADDHAWGTLTSTDNGRTWVQKTVEKNLRKKDWPTEQSAVYLGDGRILAIARTEAGNGTQFQLTSTDGGETWKRSATNISDVRISTPSLVLDAKSGMLFNYYYHRGANKLKRRVVCPGFIFSRPDRWPEPETLATGNEKRSYDAGNANATVYGANHLVALYSGSETDASVFVVTVPGTCEAGPADIPEFPEFSLPRAITQGPKDHFFASYYAINSWSPDNRYALVLETDIREGLPEGRPCTLGVVDMEDGNKFIPFTETRCWNFQEAAMAFWLPQEKDTVVFNDMRDGRFCAVVMNWKTKKERVYPHPVAAVSEDGTWAVSLNYARLYLARPDYGYHGDGQDPRKGTVFPEDDGLWRLDLRTGEAKLIVSCADVKAMVPAVKAADGLSYLCHTVISKDGKRIYFLSRSVEKSMDGVKKFQGVNWHTTAFTCNADGSNIRRCFPDGWGSSHFNWKPALSEKDAATMTVTCKFRNEVYTHAEFTVGEEEKAHQIGGPEMHFDGHCLYTIDGNFISGDGYFDGKRFFRSWKIVRLADQKVRDIGQFYVPKVYRTIYSRCDLHPRWRPDGKMIGFNSVHEGYRQVYVMDVKTK